LQTQATASVSEQVLQYSPNGTNGTNGTRRSSGPAASVTFRAQRKLKYGQVLRLVGNPAEMGNWDCAKAPGE